MRSGVLNAYKPKGPTSHDVVEELRIKLGIKKIGHAGTLDPFATGVLVVGVGRRATRILDLLKDQEKVYWVKMRLGLITETFDITGEVVQETECDVDEETVVKTVESFKGEYLQVPPAYSAKKYRGRKLYELAREGKIIRLPPKKVIIHDIWDIAYEPPYLSFRVEVSAGTYIRSLCMDIGYKLECGATAVELVRERVGEYRIEDSVNPFEVDSKTIFGKLTPVEKALEFLPGLVLTVKGVERVLSGAHPFTDDVEDIIGDFKKNDTIKLLRIDGIVIALARAERSSEFLKTLKRSGRNERIAKLEKVLGVPK